MSDERKQIAPAPNILVGASVNGKPLTLDPIRVLPITVEIREVESTLPCGLRADFGTVDVDGDELMVASGAGWGNEWITIQFQGRGYCFPITEVLNAFLGALEDSDER